MSALPGRVLVWSGRQRLALAPAAAERVFVVDAPPESCRFPKSRWARRRTWPPFESAGTQTMRWQAAGSAPGVEIAAIRVDPLGDPVTYRVDGQRNRHCPAPGQPDPAGRRQPARNPLPRRPWWRKSWTSCEKCSVRYGAGPCIQRLVFLARPL